MNNVGALLQVQDLRFWVEQDVWRNTSVFNVFTKIKTTELLYLMN